MSFQRRESNPLEKHPKLGHLQLSTSGPQECALTGSALLNTPYSNKGAALSAEERRRFKLTGLLPQHVSALELQMKRAYKQYSTRHDDLAKNTFMTSLAAQNQVLYYRVGSRLIIVQVAQALSSIKTSSSIFLFPSLKVDNFPLVT